VLAIATGGCGGSEGETGTGSLEPAGDEAAGSSFEPYQCQQLIQASSQVRESVSANQPELLAHLIGLASFYEASADDLPDDVRDDFETVLGPFDVDSSAEVEIDREPFLEAVTRINAWANASC
jgi:hypothetical protein